MNSKARLALVASAGLLLAPAVEAEYIQSFGQSEKCIALGGACVAIADDFGAYYHNPAGAAAFTRPMVGLNVRALDTTHLELRDSGGNHDIDKTNARGDYAYAPTLAGYMPAAKDVTVGLAFGAPFAITADWGNKDGIHRYDMSYQALFLLDLTPTVAWKVNDKLSLGLGVNITAFKHLRTETLIPANALLGGTPTPTSPTVGSITIQTNKDFHLGIPPDDFSTSFDELAFTVGGMYKVSDTLNLGAMYRTKTRSKWEGDVTLDLTPVGAGKSTTGFTLDMDMPGHAQVGFAWQVIPDKLTWSFDIQRTFWSETRGFGKRSDIELSTPLLGAINRIKVDYKARDTNTYRTGLQYRLTPVTTLLAGYAYDEHIFDSRNVDILTYDSDRHIFSLGANFDLRDKALQTGWVLNTSVQCAHYISRTIAGGQSGNLGGVSALSIDSSGTLSFVPNSEAFTFGGNIWVLGASAQYSF